MLPFFVLDGWKKCVFLFLYVFYKRTQDVFFNAKGRKKEEEKSQTALLSCSFRGDEEKRERENYEKVWKLIRKTCPNLIPESVFNWHFIEEYEK